MSTIFPQANGLYWRDITGGCEQDDSSQRAVWLNLLMFLHLGSDFFLDQSQLFLVICVLKIIC